jgi:hypothetical protein
MDVPSDPGNFFDADASNFEHRFYRIELEP